tara:strand:- start:41 stop:568 length:528 start_codon:yes stop_codon:yes gene_type:complete
MTSIQDLPADMLIQIIQTLTLDKDKEIAKLKADIKEKDAMIWRFEEAIENQDGRYFQCEECTGFKYGDCCFDDALKIVMPDCIGDKFICIDCFDSVNEDEEYQEKYLELSTFYVVGFDKDTYNTYEEIPENIKKSNTLIRKFYYKSWFDLYNEDSYNENDCGDDMVVEIINGSID